jgi:iron-sulfur cluster assembly protein
MIELSPSAIAEIQRLRTRHTNPSAFFRLKVEPGGCAGLAYLTKFETETQSDDQIFDCNGIRVAIDAQSASYLDDIRIDFSEDLMGGSFRFHNPNAKKSCDCGVSFSINES